jgi:hypothetical protein
MLKSNLSSMSIDALLKLKAEIERALNDPPPLKWSDLRYVFDIQEDCNGKEAIQA